MSGNKRPTSSSDVSGPQPAPKRPRESKRDTPDALLLDRALSGYHSANVKTFPGIDVRHTAMLQQSLIPLCASEALSQTGNTHDFFCVGCPCEPAQQYSFPALPPLHLKACSSTGGGDTCNVAPSGNLVIKSQVLKYNTKVPVTAADGTARDVSMKVRVDPAVHGRLLEIPVTSVAQDAAEADAELKDMQASGGRRNGRTIDAVLQLQIGALAAELLSQPRFIRLRTKCQLHSTVDDVPSNHTGGVAKLTLAELATGSVRVRLPPFRPAFCQQLSTAAAAGSVSLSVTIVEAGMAADQTTSFGQPAQQTPAVARIQLELLPASLPVEQTAALPAAGAFFSAAFNPAAAAEAQQPRLSQEPYAATAAADPVIARLVSFEQQLNGIASRVSRLAVNDSVLHPIVQDHSVGLHELSTRVDMLAETMREHRSHFRHVLQDNATSSAPSEAGVIPTNSPEASQAALDAAAALSIGYQDLFSGHHDFLVTPALVEPAALLQHEPAAHRPGPPLAVSPADAELPDAVLQWLQWYSSCVTPPAAASKQIRWICRHMWPWHQADGQRRKQAKLLKVNSALWQLLRQEKVQQVPAADGTAAASGHGSYSWVHVCTTQHS